MIHHSMTDRLIKAVMKGFGLAQHDAPATRMVIDRIQRRQTVSTGLLFPAAKSKNRSTVPSGTVLLTYRWC